MMSLDVKYTFCFNCVGKNCGTFKIFSKHYWSESWPNWFIRRSVLDGISLVETLHPIGQHPFWMAHVSVLVGCWLLFSFTLILSMDDINLALSMKLLLIAQSLSAASDTLYSLNHHPYHFHQAPSWVVIWKGSQQWLFPAFELTITPPLFFFSSSLGSFIKSLGKWKPVSLKIRLRNPVLMH